MTHSIETSGKTIEQALQKALKELNARPEDVDIEILPGANKGFLGGLFGSKMVAIRVTRREAKGRGDHVETLKEILAKLLGLMGVDYELTIETLPDTTFININSAGLDGLLIGRRGETLASLQHVVNRVFTSQTGEHSKITIDVGGYIKRKHRLLVERARKIAERVRETEKNSTSSRSRPPTAGSSIWPSRRWVTSPPTRSATGCCERSSSHRKRAKALTTRPGQGKTTSRPPRVSSGHVERV